MAFDDTRLSSSSDTTPKAAKTRGGRDDEAFLEQARERFKQAEDADKAQKQREREDLRFYAGDQWPDDIKTARDGQNAQNGLPPVPARPCITINKTREPIRQVLNQERGSDIGVELVPIDDFGELEQPIDDNEITLREGLIRRIQRDSEAHDARTWAFSRSTICGRGFYAVKTRYLPGKTRDQEVYIERIYNQASVTLDPAHEQPDGSDAKWGFIGTWMGWSEYKAKYPKAANGSKNVVTETSDDDFRAFADDYKPWFRSEGEQRFVRVMDYWYIEDQTKTLVMLPDGQDVWKDELRGEMPEGADTRDVIEPEVKWATIDALQVLDESDWPCEFIPIVKVLGEELQPYDTDRRVEGMVRPMREPCQGYNYMVSALVERIGLAPLPPLNVAEGQVEGYEAWYQAANTRTLPYLPYKVKDLEGNPAPPPYRTDTGLGQIIGPLTEAVSMFNDANQSVSSIHDPNLGKTDTMAQSGRAIQALQQQGVQGTSNFMDNLARSIRYEGKIINALLYPIYGSRPGRIARILDHEDEPDTVMIGQPFTMQNGRPQAVQQPPGPTQPGQPQPGTGSNVSSYKLTPNAKFTVGVTVTKATDLRRQQEAELMGQAIQSAPNLLSVIGDLYFGNMDGPGADEIAKRLKATLDPRVLAAEQQQGQGGPEVVQHLQQQLQQVTQQAQAMHQQIQTDSAKEQVKQQGQMQIAQFQAQTDSALQIELKRMDIAGRIEIARITAAKQAADTMLEAQEESIALQHEAMQSHLDRAHEAGMAAQQAAVSQQQQQAQAAQQQQSQQSDQQHQQQMQQAQQAAQQQQQQNQPQGGQ